MSVSVVDLFSIGIGPSSSHTVGPMRAARTFIDSLPAWPAEVHVTLRGSLAATGRGHGTDRAVLLGLAGWEPTTVPADVEPAHGADIPANGEISGPAGSVRYEFELDRTPVPEHPNCVIFTARDADGATLAENAEYFSVGGGFILSRADLDARLNAGPDLPWGAATAAKEQEVPYPFTTGIELLAHCARAEKDISEVMAANEAVLHADEGGYEAVAAHLDEVWRTMRQCVTAGIDASGVLPGGLQVTRRAPRLYDQLLEAKSGPRGDALGAMEWVNLYALAVNEENAAGGRVVTAPTNGAAGIIPAVMHYARDFLGDFTATQARRFLLTAGAVGIIVKENASISGAEVGCQGEVGSASAMAAAGLCEVLGGSPAQVENAAEIALEHNLGLTCDPVGGLVQIPCIERNAIGSVKSINAARLARLGEGTNRVTLDEVVRTMAETGRDMLTKYKETSTGGLATTLGLPVNLTEC
ncbi:L-serine ammonia-lyase [Corynebacterium halotolerans]|uniref:L-serine dehydratase n=1 Tax=Corynebacterium halotolerans YIM 70093 = DSM 44683 TaxID=1121362 RepID=M1P7H9_9CORY|nr:L-serine ammonia-lyase [Corynebacterium halotolerans]AGF72601.1 L-serine dehydratase [Corynebacterium halotolerans YIM 70093 = DSM 44683]